MPRSFRDQVHYRIRRFNSNALLIALSSWRHQITCRKLANLSNLKLRIGESRKFEGWVSTNYQVMVKNFLDGRRSLKGVKTLHYVYLDNVIEHLTREDGLKMLENLFDAMRTDGVIRLATPDLRSICEKYLTGNPNYIDELRADMAQHGLEVTSMPDLFRVTFCAFGHEKGFIYDFATLKSSLESVGFIDVQAFRPGVSNRPDLLGLESRTGKSDEWSQMCIEAVRP